jgi:hypothetical protein
MVGNCALCKDHPDHDKGTKTVTALADGHDGCQCVDPVEQIWDATTIKTCIPIPPAVPPPAPGPDDLTGHTAVKVY